MNDLSHRFPLSRLHPCAPLLEAIRNGQFDGVPLCAYSREKWVDVAQWFHDVRGEPEDAAQALDEAAEMIAKSDYYPNWQALSEAERDGWQDYDTFFEARGRFA